MDTTNLFAAALNLPEPWFVSAVDFKDTKDGSKELHIEGNDEQVLKIESATIHKKSWITFSEKRLIGTFFSHRFLHFWVSCPAFAKKGRLIPMPRRILLASLLAGTSKGSRS